jgi:hypothetical protein
MADMTDSRASADAQCGETHSAQACGSSVITTPSNLLQIEMRAANGFDNPG